MEQQYERPPLRPCLEHVDGEAIDVRHEPRFDARGKRVVAVRRQLLEGRHCRDLRRCSGGRDRHASERRSAREKLASRESGRRRAFHVASLRFFTSPRLSVCSSAVQMRSVRAGRLRT